MDQLLEVGAEESWRVINDYGLYLDICHFSIALMGAKKKLGSTAREKPLISAGVSVFACFLSGFTLNFLCGLPILGSLQATTTLFLIAVLWMLMNFIIPDIFDKIFNFPPVLIVLVAGKELLRNKKIYGSIDKALKIYPESFHIIAFLGLVGCAAGGALTHYLTAIQNKSFTGNQKPALATKFSVIFAIFHTCATMEIPFFGWLPSRAEVCFIQFSVVAPILIAEKFGLVMDPFQPFQNVLYKVFVGMGDEAEPVEKSEPAPVKTSSKKSRKTKKE